MKKPKKFIITGHYGSKLAKETAKKVIELLHNRNSEVWVDSSFGISMESQKPLSGLDGDIALAFGGDGTVLYAAAGVKNGIPVLGINCGRRGALAACDAECAGECIKKVLMGKYRVEERLRIGVEIDGRKHGEVLNEVVVVPERHAEMMECKIEAGGKIIGEECDGVIISTPTGSTAHALSAGGAVIDARCEAVEIVTIGSALGTRPGILPADCEIRVSVAKKAVAVLDGRERIGVKQQVVLRRGRDAKLAFVKGLPKHGLPVPSARAGGLPASAKLVLTVLERNRAMRQAEIARACCIPLKTAYRSLKLLEKEGLVMVEGREYRLSCA